MDATRSWGWIARRIGISAFVLMHLGATAIWVMPECPIRVRFVNVVRWYMMPLGLWQYWGMFAPDPILHTLTLEADVVDAHGLRYNFAFPKLADYSFVGQVPRFRHSKFAANLGIPGLEAHRRLAAKHAVRRLELPAESYPAVVRLQYQVRATPTPGGPPADPMAPTVPYLLGSYKFEGPEEVRP
jgi:hypothetical protein